MNYSLHRWLCYRKRRRQTLEEDESMDEEEFGRLKSEADQNLMPDDFVLPEDLTGANLFVWLGCYNMDLQL